MTWRFNEMRPGDINVDPFERAFFATEALGGITDALVREAIQNSLDAATGDDDVVRVRFCLDPSAPSTLSGYLADLLPHADAAAETRSAVPVGTRQLRVLTVEDSGTRGLEGDPRQYDDDEGQGQRNNFYYFWRNIGRSRKETEERGRWGLGKTVFAAASRFNGFFGLTVRESDTRPLLMGQAVLKIHRIGSRRYQPYGYYGRHENGFSMPFDDVRTTHDFIQNFGLRRDRPGLSIVIPYPEEEITVARILESAIHHYFYPLLAGDLEVEVEEKGHASILLQASGLEREIRGRNQLGHLLPLIELARWGLGAEAEAVARLAAPSPGHAPKFGEKLLAVADLERLRQRYDEGRRVALDVRVPVERLGDTPRDAEFRVLMERDAEGERGQGYFVRQGITIANAKARRPRGVRWIVVITDPTLSAFLGDAENPAHTEWQRSSPKLKAKYERGPSTIDFVRAVPANVAALLSRPADRRDPDLLRDVFLLARDADAPFPQRPEPTPDGTDEGTTEQPIPDLDNNGGLVVDQVRTGFRVRGRLDKEVSRRLEVLAAYQVLRGNPFRHYSPLDFCMDRSIAVQARGARVIKRHLNRLEIEVEEAEFNLLVTRFDEKRDLRVSVRPLEAAS